MQTLKPRFEFDRYVNGVLMAESVTIERENSLEDAIKSAARLASKGPNGETPVLVYRPAAPFEAGLDRQIVDEAPAPVEGLETVGYVRLDRSKLIHPRTLENHSGQDMEPVVTRSQAEAIIAAKDAEIERLQKINAMIMGDDENAPRYTTKRLKQEVERVTQVMRGEASDREAHVKTLEADNAAKDREIAEEVALRVGAIDRMKAAEADNAALTARVKELEQVIQHETDCIKAASDKIEALEAKLAAANKDINELDNLVAGYHSRLETTETQLAAAEKALEQVATTPLSGWTIAQGIARAALSEVRS